MIQANELLPAVNQQLEAFMHKTSDQLSSAVARANSEEQLNRAGGC